MPPKTGRTSRKKERDIMDVFKDATKKKSALGAYLLKELEKEHVKAEDIYKKLQGMEYKAVRVQDVRWLLRNYKDMAEIQTAVTEKGY